MSEYSTDSSSDKALKIAFIGAHGVGKTTLTYGLASRLKARDVALEVVVEVARRCPLPLNEGTTVAAQSWILHTQIADEVAAAARYPVVLCDRSVLDNYVYLLLSHGPNDAHEGLVRHWLPSYDLLVNVPAVEQRVMGDGTRATDLGFRDAVQERLNREIAQRRIPTLDLDPDDRDGWLDRASARAQALIEPPQMQLPTV